MSEEKQCEHKWVFLRSEDRKGYTQRVDIFYCEKCMEYKDKVVWEGRRFK